MELARDEFSGTGQFVLKRGADRGCGAYMLNTWSEEQKTGFYSYLACFVDTSSVDTYVFVSYAGYTRWNRLNPHTRICN